MHFQPPSINSLTVLCISYRVNRSEVVSRIEHGDGMCVRVRERISSSGVESTGAMDMFRSVPEGVVFLTGIREKDLLLIHHHSEEPSGLAII